MHRISLIAIFAALLALACVRADAEASDPSVTPDTSGYRGAATGWSDLLSKGKDILIRRDSDSILTVRDSVTDSVILGILRPPGWIRSYTLAFDHPLLAVAMRNGQVQFWDTKSGFCVKTSVCDLPSVDAVWFLRSSDESLCVTRLLPLRDQRCSVTDSAGLPVHDLVPYDTGPLPLPQNPTPVLYGDAVAGKVTLHVYVDATGVVRKWEILNAAPTNMGFEEEAVKLIQEWKFTPATLSGQPVAAWTTIPLASKPR